METFGMNDIPRAATADEVPILDLAPLLEAQDIARLAERLRHACETIGFFYVQHHGVPQQVTDDVFAATRRYFDLPLEERLQMKISIQVTRRI
jgi:isopenicillin N synthase-like dioxygenase